MDPIQIVLLELKSKIRNLKMGAAPPEIKVGGLGPCGPPGSATYGFINALSTYEIKSILLLTFCC